MDRLVGAAVAISRTGSLVGGVLLLAAAVVIGIDIVLRATVSRTVGGADELSGLALAIASAWGLSYALLGRAHIRVDTLYGLAGRRMRILLDLLGHAGLLAFSILITWYAWKVLAQTWTSQTRSIALSVPLVVPQALWFAGLAFLVLTEVLLLAHVLRALAQGDVGGFFAGIGVRSVEEEIEEEESELHTRTDTKPMAEPP